MTRKPTHEPCSLDQDCWLNDGHVGPHSYAEHGAAYDEAEAERRRERAGRDQLALVRDALTDEDEIAHGEAVGAGGGTGECAYCGDAWPCHTQRAIDRLLARIEDPGFADLSHLRDQVIVAARELVVSMILQPPGLVGRHRERFEDLRHALVAMGPDAAVARAEERAAARSPRCTCGHALVSHRQDSTDPYVSDGCVACDCATFDNRDDATMQGEDA